ncbi:leucine-rich melanocyte differentiation-associated protein [Pelomyxa schiedti]|nr:leucine-rich melanocyte differentiation-associated protein [Pelomyxa schiedti]
MSRTTATSTTTASGASPPGQQGEGSNGLARLGSGSNVGVMAVAVSGGGSVLAAGRDLTSIPPELVELAPQALELDLSYNSLRSSQNLEHFTKLVELVLDNNEMSECSHFPVCPTLKLLSMNKNQLSDLEAFLAIATKRFPNLANLSLVKNPCCPYFSDDSSDYRRYRMRVLYFLRRLRYLDGKPVLASERAEAIKRGPFCKVNKPMSLEIPADLDISDVGYKPLPPPSADASYPTVLLKQEVVYLGNKSEGNRFITNDHLEPKLLTENP